MNKIDAFELNDDALDTVAGGASPEASWTSCLAKITTGAVCCRCGHDTFRCYKMSGDIWRAVCHSCGIQDINLWPQTHELDVISHNWM